MNEIPFRRRPIAILAALLVFLAACGDGSPGSSSSGQLDLASAVPAEFQAHASVGQVYVIDAQPGESLDLAMANGTVVQTAAADSQGSLIFPSVEPERHYFVASQSQGKLSASDAGVVMAVGDVPDQSFYAGQNIPAGYGYLETRDGTTLAINVYLPGPAENGPYPTVIEYSGYDPANPTSPQPSTAIATALGYAAVGVNMRGTGCSGGAFQYFEPLQSTDGYDAVETIAAQPWVLDNKVGMVGLSYPGISELFVAQLDPPHLESIAPLSVIADTYRGTLYPGGILNNGFAVGWAMDRQHDAMPGGQPWSQTRIDAGDQTCIANQKLKGQAPNLLEMINASKYYDPAIGDPIAPATFVGKINVPVFLAGAWQDEQVGPYFATMLDRFTGTDKLHFTMSNGGHTEPLSPTIFSRWIEFLSFYVAHKIPQFPASGKAVLAVLADQIFGVPSLEPDPDRFTNAPSFDAALAQFEAEPKVRILFENGTGSDVPGAPVPGFEQSFDAWPIPELQATPWYFAAGGRLDPNPPTSAGADSFVYDPSTSQLVTFDGSNSDDVWKASVPWNWRELNAGKAVAYATDPLAATLVMAGSGSVDLWIGSTAKDVDLQVTLSEIRPDGQETYVQSGWLRASHRKLDEQASTELRPVQTHLQADAADLPAGERVLARVELFPFAHVFRAGSRLRLSVEAPGADRPLWKFDALAASGQVTNTIERSATHPSRVVLPVVPNVTVPTPLAPCGSLRGQPCREYVELTNAPG